MAPLATAMTIRTPVSSLPAWANALRELGDLSEVPAVDSLLGVASEVLDMTRATKRHREICYPLSDMVSEALAVVQRELVLQSEISDGMLYALDGLRNVLSAIKTRVQQLKDAGLVQRALSSTDPTKHLQNDLRMALSSFQLQSHISLQIQLIKRVDDDNSRFQHLVSTLDAQLAEAKRALSPGSQPTSVRSVNEELRPRTLPLAAPLLFGRDAELAELVDLLTAEVRPARIALLGPGGVGKSSLAVAAISHERVAALFGRQSYFIPCDSITSASGLVSGVAAHLGIAGDHLLKRLISCLSRSRAVIVLDNFETPWEDKRMRVDVERLLSTFAAISSLTLLVTMRGAERPLGVEWTNPPLSPLKPLQRSASLQVFLAIASRHNDSPELHTLLDYLDDLPLAITLLARMSEHESLSALLARWDLESTSIVRGARAGNRLSCLDTSIRVSLTSPRMRGDLNALNLLQLLSLLPAGLPEALQPSSISELLKSASVLKSCALAYSDDSGRLRVLSPIRLFTLKHHPPKYELVAPLEDYYVQLSQLCKRLGLSETPQILPQLLSEAANVESLCSYTVEHWPEVGWPIPVICCFDEPLRYAGLKPSRLLQADRLHATRPAEHQLQILMRRIIREPDRAEQTKLANHALQLARTAGLAAYEGEVLVRLSIAIYSMKEKLDLCNQALAIFEKLGSDAAAKKALCLRTMAGAAFFGDDYAAAERYATEGVLLAESCNSLSIAISTRTILAHVHIRQGRLLTASELADISVRQAHAMDDTTSLTVALTCKAGILVAQGYVGEAIDVHNAAATLYARRGELASSAFNRMQIASLLANGGETIAARNMLEEAIPVAQVTPWSTLIGRTIAFDVCRAEGDLDSAEALAFEALSLARERNYTRIEARMRDMLAEIAVERGYPDDASINIVLALLLYARIGNMQYLIPAICRLGRVLLLLGDCDTAYQVLQWALEWSHKAGMLPVQAACLVTLAELQQTVGAPDIAAWEEALRMCELTRENRLANKCRYWLSVD